MVTAFMYEQKLRETLKKAGYKVTSERMELFRTIASRHKPISISQLAELASSRMNESTVYRNIDVLEKIGAVVRVYTGWKFKLELSEQYREHHHHMTCTSCDRLIEFEESEALVAELVAVASLHDFTLQQHTLELRGLCRDCQN